MERVRARDVARAERRGALRIDGRAHRGGHGGMLSPGEVIVAAPHRDVAWALTGAVKTGAREGADDPFQLGEHPVASFVVQTTQMAGEKRLVVHCPLVS